MKLYINLALIILAVTISSCCKRTGYPLADISIHYAEDFGGKMIYDIRTSRSDFEEVIDTSEIMGARSNSNQSTGFGIRLILDDEKYNHILMTMDSSRIDTISQIIVDRDKCEDVQTIGYLWNGEYSTKIFREVN